MQINKTDFRGPFLLPVSLRCSHHFVNPMCKSSNNSISIHFLKRIQISIQSNSIIRRFQVSYIHLKFIQIEELTCSINSSWKIVQLTTKLAKNISNMRSMKVFNNLSRKSFVHTDIAKTNAIQYIVPPYFQYFIYILQCKWL